VPDLFHVDNAAKIRCFGRPAALDAIRQPAGTLLGLFEDLEGQLSGEGNAALVIDHTDGWSFFTIVGEDSGEVFARIANWKLPESTGAPVFTVGKTCDVAGKLFVRPNRIDIMTGAEVVAHVRETLEHAGHAVGMHTVEAPAVDPIGVGAEGVPVS
jgi:hypothetical protein